MSWSDVDEYPPVDTPIPPCPVCGRPMVPMSAMASFTAGGSVSNNEFGWVCADHGKWKVSNG